MDTMPKTEEEWKRVLTPEQYRVVREKATEAPFTGKYYASKERGMYTCVACGAELFSSETKFDSGTGWPSFYNPVNRDNVELRTDESQDMARTEVLCKRCGAHLGHVFEDAPKTPSGKRYCINSVCLDLKKS